LRRAREMAWCERKPRRRRSAWREERSGKEGVEPSRGRKERRSGA
jgi:hypothetical protein